MDCCGGVCGPTTEGGPLGCTLLSQCRVAGETCTAPTDCCTGQCSAGPGGSGSCQALPGCHPALEICKTDMDCCSGRCDTSVIDGASRCAWAPGCRPGQERCASNAECCAGNCKMGPPGVGRCADMPAPMMMSHCLAVGEVCKKAMDCCPGESCSPVATGGSRCVPLATSCVGDGYPCTLSEECCGGHCLPDGTGALSCRSVYAPIGAPCTATDDCCSGGTCVGTPGSLICAPLDSSAPGAAMCTGSRRRLRSHQPRLLRRHRLRARRRIDDRLRSGHLQRGSLARVQERAHEHRGMNHRIDEPQPQPGRLAVLGADAAAPADLRLDLDGLHAIQDREPHHDARADGKRPRRRHEHPADAQILRHAQDALVVVPQMYRNLDDRRVPAGPRWTPSSMKGVSSVIATAIEASEATGGRAPAPVSLNFFLTTVAGPPTVIAEVQ